MRARRAAATVGVAAPLALACTGGPALTGASPPAVVDAGLPAGQAVTIHTSTPASELGPAAPASATWAAYRGADGTWLPLAETAPGSATYAVPSSGPRWAAAFACADDQSSLVTVREGAVGGQGSSDVELDRFCARAAPDAVTLSGTLAHLAQGTNWLDFGYSLEARGAVLPSTGTSASYEEVNLVAGTWDVAFGLRPSPGEAYSRIAILRRQSLAADTTLDVDIAGPSAGAPGRETLRIDGLDPAHESILAPVYYAMNGGRRGLDMGPQNIPTATSLTLAYATLPAAIQQPDDRYRAEVTARANDDTAARGVIAELTSPQELALTLPAPLAPPAATVVTTAPYPRLRAVIAARPDTDQYALDATAQPSNRSSRTWRITVIDPPSGDAALELPDLSTVPGFDPAWSLPKAQDVSVTSTATARVQSAGRMTQEPWSSHTLTVTP